MWRVNKLDFLTWVVTALASLLVDLDIGLLVGVSFSILTVLIVSQLATVTSLGRSELEDILLPTGRKDIKTIPGIKIFRSVPSWKWDGNVRPISALDLL